MVEHLFVAISFDTHQELRRIQQDVVQRLESLLITDKAIIKAQEHLHCTLYFIGSYSNKELATITHQCDLAVKNYNEHGGIGFLTSYRSNLDLKMLGNHGVIALLLEPSEQLVQLYQSFVMIFEKNNSPHTIRSFLPHITVARLKRIQKKDLQKIKIPISMALNQMASTLKPINLPINELILFASEQGNYRVIKKFSV